MPKSLLLAAIAACLVISTLSGKNEKYTYIDRLEQLTVDVISESMKLDDCKPKCYDNDNSCSAKNECYHDDFDKSYHNVTAIKKCVDPKTRFVHANTAIAEICMHQFYHLTLQNYVFTTFIFTLHLGFLALTTDGTLHNQLMSLLNLYSKKEVQEVVSTVAENYQKHNDNFTSVLNMIVFADTSQPFTPEFKKIFKDLGNGETGNLDFEDSCCTANHINKWINDKTCNKDEKLLSCGDTSNSTGPIFAAANNVELRWSKAFSPKKYVNFDFHDIDGNVTPIEGWVAEGEVKYADISELNVKCFLLPLAEEGYSIFFIIPNDPKQMEKVLFKMRNPKVFDDALARVKSRTVKLTSPFALCTCSTKDCVQCVKLANVLSELFIPKDVKAQKVSKMFQKFHYCIKNITDTNVDVVKPSPDCVDTEPLNFIMDTPFIYHIICGCKIPIFSGLHRLGKSIGCGSKN